jgi:predicted amidohydrolase YtcJ
MSLIIKNAKLHTMEGRVYQAAAIDGDIITRLGSNEDVIRYADNSANVIDLKGKSVVPGFIDTHVHLVGYGCSLNSVTLNGLTSRNDVIETCRSHLEQSQLDAGQWLYGRGWDQNLFHDGKFLTKDDLDKISITHPILLLRNCGHVAAVNSLALELTCVTCDTAIAGGQFIKDDKGDLNGVITEAALEWFKKQKNANQSILEIKTAIKTGINKLLSYGVTSIHSEESYDLGYSGDFMDIYTLYKEMADNKELAMRVYQKVALPNGPDVDRFLENGIRTGDGDHYYRMGPVKQWVDGTLGARTAALLEDYSDDKGNKGLYYYTAGQLYQNMEKLHLAGMQICLHTIGDGSLEMILNQFEKLLHQHPRKDHRHRLVHVFVGNKKQYQRIAALGLNINTQPAALSSDLKMLDSRLGEKRGRQCYAWKTLRDCGICVNCGSDIPVETPDVFKGIYALVERKNVETPDGPAYNPNETISVDEALEMYTKNGAYASFEEAVKGTICEGKLADLAVLNHNPYEVASETLKNIKVEITILGGKIVYQREKSFSASKS